MKEASAEKMNDYPPVAANINNGAKSSASPAKPVACSDETIVPFSTLFQTFLQEPIFP